MGLAKLHQRPYRLVAQDAASPFAALLRGRIYKVSAERGSQSGDRGSNPRRDAKNYRVAPWNNDRASARTKTVGFHRQCAQTNHATSVEAEAGILVK